MADFDFVSIKLHPPGEFALQWVPWVGYDLARKALGWVSPSTRITSPPTEGRSRSWQQKNIPRIVGETQVMLALALDAPFHFVLSLRTMASSIIRLKVSM
ncbi:hypothetical protein Noc_2510 [Nitrosococcus oceani ATCC 19707]|uniref:Uncharacterized protein n=1 Tax=Nitrosococcus oceani (strain ATCC 19707 / BCRC 17464 / JCM 30415 / NCIMB 11848 / C-107) TaxID=323261 RepID=Q3J883_NITOC|nr:hypothetical protein [Nitrosococcus oceani]ABA58963.1 hypothetical protein Noc_2510 [Nitrosococcus oceani ATCC 19707]GEM18941.1 hypothetical protein NONS58_03060 [Nitrosococcus oceani]